MWVGFFARHLLLVPLIVSHLVLAGCLETGVPEGVHRGTRIGAAVLELGGAGGS